MQALPAKEEYSGYRTLMSQPLAIPVSYFNEYISVLILTLLSKSCSQRTWVDGNLNLVSIPVSFCGKLIFDTPALKNMVDLSLSLKTDYILFPGSQR